MKDIKAPAFARIHDFNVEGMIANNFGHGDDWEPIDPMDDPRIMGVLLQPRESENAQADYRSAGGR